MLSCYPIAATQENWLHETLVSMITDVHQKLDAGTRIAKTPKNWKTLLPNNLDAHRRAHLETARGIKDRFFAYTKTVENLQAQDRALIGSVMASQNNIVGLLNGTGNIQQLTAPYQDVNSAVRDLFEFCYEKLTDFDVRKRQYEIVFDSLKDRICPFCGIERLMHPEETAQDQDHYLAKSIYPFAAANMRNLVPMCRCCNRDYKKNLDIIRDLASNRRLAFDPYNCIAPSITLERSSLNSAAPSPAPQWVVDFQPNSPESRTWDSIFQIKNRYYRDILEPYFESWQRSFTAFIREWPQGGADPRDLLDIYIRIKSNTPTQGISGILEPEAFKFLLSEYDDGNERVVKMIKDLVAWNPPTKIEK